MCISSSFLHEGPARDGVACPLKGPNKSSVILGLDLTKLRTASVLVRVKSKQLSLSSFIKQVQEGFLKRVAHM